MRQFLTPYKPTIFKAIEGYSELSEIDWTIRSNHIEVGDEIFFYSSKPTQAITIKGVITELNIDKNSMIDDSKYYTNEYYYTEDYNFIQKDNEPKLTRVKLIGVLTEDKQELLTLDTLRSYGFKGYLQSTRMLDKYPELYEYINSVYDK